MHVPSCTPSFPNDGVIVGQTTLEMDRVNPRASMSNILLTARDWFEAALELPLAERGEWLARHCADPLLVNQVTAMLDAESIGDGLLDGSAMQWIEELQVPVDLQTDGLIGSRIGGFRLVRLLGQGGMATVFLGERSNGDFEQRVAVKLLRRGLYSELEQRLFRRERQTLANLSHPNIAHLIDGGVTDTGIPYLVMEYVDGVSISEHVVQRQLDLRARLRLFVTICHAVDAAHRALIVHRDIKPSNILVDGQGNPKLLDFGIAKLLDEDEGATRSAYVPLTPGYAAPEQYAGGAITTATDVYALGILLHELLLGERPRLEPNPRRASSRVAELTTDLWLLPLSRQALRSALKGDIDNVLATALEAEAGRRYASAGALADDISRYLNAQPVLAHPPSRWYRARKFVQRHRGGVAASATLVLAVITSLGIALWQARNAQIQAQRATSVRDFVLDLFDAAKDQLPRDVRPTPDVLARAAVKKIDANQNLDAPTRAEFLSTLGAISQTSSDYALARDLADRALAALDAGGEGPSRLRLGIEIARIEAMQSLGESEQADQLLGARMNEVRAVDDEIAVHGTAMYAATRLSRGALEESIALARESSAIADRVFGTNDERSLVASLRVGDALGSAGQHERATRDLAAALARWDASGVPPNRDYQGALLNLAASISFLGDYDRSEKLHRQALQLALRIFESPHERIADAQESLGALLSVRGHHEEAEPLLEQASATFATLFGSDHPSIASVQSALARLAFDQKDYSKATRRYQGVTELCTRAKLDSDPTCARAWQNLSTVYLRQDMLDEAEAANLRSLQLRRVLYGENHAQYANALAGLGAIHLARMDFAQALAEFDQSIAISDSTGHGESLEAAQKQGARAAALIGLHRASEALPALDIAEQIVAKLVPDDHSLLQRMLTLRAQALDQLGRIAETRSVARQAIALDDTGSLLKPGQLDWLKSRAH